MKLVLAKKNFKLNFCLKTKRLCHLCPTRLIKIVMKQFKLNFNKCFGKYKNKMIAMSLVDRNWRDLLLKIS